ncbi:MAG: DUF2232 domain-containing protein [Pseudomonadota bacterium]
MFGSQETKTIGISAIIALVLYFSGFLIILTPLPLMYAYMARGQNAGWFASGLASLAVVVVYSLFGNIAASGYLAYLPIPGQGMAEFMPAIFLKVFGVGYFAFFAAIALTLAWGTQQRFSIMRWGTYALLAGSGILIATFAVAKLFGATGLAQGASSYMRYVLGEIAQANQATSSQNTQLAFIADHTEQIVTTMLRALPSLTFVYIVVTVAINAVAGLRIVRVRHTLMHSNDMARFKLPDWLIWGVITSGITFFADNYVFRSNFFGALSLNLLIGLGALYFLQGMAVTVYFLRGIRFSLLRTLAYIVMIIFLQTVSIALVVLGIFDVWANFRLRRWRMLQQQ